MKMLKKLWDGEFSLVKTYWLFYVLMWNLALLPLAVFRQTSQSTQDSYLILGLLLAVIFITYGCVVLVGLWRSANKYGGWWLWVNLAKVVALLGVVIVAVSIFGALQTNLIYGGVLLVSAVATLTLVKFYGTDRYTKNIKIFLVSCLALTMLLIVGLALKVNPIGSTKKSKWMPLTTSMVMDYSKDKFDKQITYLDFNSIVEVNGKLFAYVANEFMDDGKFKNSSKQYFEFNCSVPPKLRVISAISYQKRVEDGFGAEVGRDDDIQATLAKSAVSSGRTYTGGWDTYDSLQKSIFEYCDNPKSYSMVDADTNKSLCSYAKRDLTILKAVCESK